MVTSLNMYISANAAMVQCIVRRTPAKHGHALCTSCNSISFRSSQQSIVPRLRHTAPPPPALIQLSRLPFWQITLVERGLIVGALAAECEGGLALDRACYQGALQCLAAFQLLLSSRLVKVKGNYLSSRENLLRRDQYI